MKKLVGDGAGSGTRLPIANVSPITSVILSAMATT